MNYSRPGRTMISRGVDSEFLNLIELQNLFRFIDVNLTDRYSCFKAAKIFYPSSCIDLHFAYNDHLFPYREIVYIMRAVCEKDPNSHHELKRRHPNDDDRIELSKVIILIMDLFLH